MLPWRHIHLEEIAQCQQNGFLSRLRLLLPLHKCLRTYEEIVNLKPGPFSPPVSSTPNKEILPLIQNLLPWKRIESEQNTQEHKHTFLQQCLGTAKLREWKQEGRRWDPFSINEEYAHLPTTWNLSSNLLHPFFPSHKANSDTQCFTKCYTYIDRYFLSTTKRQPCLLKCNCFIGKIGRSRDEVKKALTVTKSVSVVSTSGHRVTRCLV